MAKFTQHTIETAPKASHAALAGTKAAFGMVPNLQTFMSESPALINAYAQVWDIYHKQSSFNAIEQQVVLLTANFENNCEYCMSGHSFLAKSMGMDGPTLEALRNNTKIPDARLEALHSFTGKVVRDRGWVSGADVDAFLGAGFTKQQVFDVIAGVALKVMSNYTNHITHTPLDGFMAETKWTKPQHAKA